MSDIFEKVTGDQDIFKSFLLKFQDSKGYVERSDRRASDKLLRDKIADEFETQYQRISSLQRDLINHGEIDTLMILNLLPSSCGNLLTARTASYGYAGLFDAIKIGRRAWSGLRIRLCVIRSLRNGKLGN